MDISVLLMAENIEAHANFLGDVVSVSEFHGSDCSNPRFVLLHITGIVDNAPQAPQFKRLKEMLESNIKNERDFLRSRVLEIQRFGS